MKMSHGRTCKLPCMAVFIGGLRVVQSDDEIVYRDDDEIFERKKVARWIFCVVSGSSV